MSYEIEKMISPSLRLTLLQHFRSYLNIGELKVSEVVDIEFRDISITAFSTKYEFDLHHRYIDDGVAKSPLFDLGGVSKVESKVIDRWYTGSISEILEPGDNYPRFEEHFKLIEDSSEIQIDTPLYIEDIPGIPEIKD